MGACLGLGCLLEYLLVPLGCEQLLFALLELLLWVAGGGGYLGLAAERRGFELSAALLQLHHVVELCLNGLFVLLLLRLELLVLLPGDAQLLHQVLDLVHVVVLRRDLL